jgi:TolB protein
MNRRQVLMAGGALAAVPLFWSISSRDRAVGSEVKGQLRRLTEPGAGDNRASFMPDGKTILFASMRSGKSQIWATGLSGGRAWQFHQSAMNDFGRVSPNADGSRICFSSDRSGNNAIYVLDLKSGATTPVSDPAFWSFGPSWSSRDVIAYFSKKGGNVTNIWTVHPDGSDPKQLTDLPGACRQPWWSPDGGALALCSDQGSGTTSALWIVTHHGQDARIITFHGSYQQPYWSPDGQRIAVSARIDEPHYRIYIVSADGSNPRPIQQPLGIDNVHPAWSSDGSHIAFTSGEGANGSIHVYDFI